MVDSGFKTISTLRCCECGNEIEFNSPRDSQKMGIAVLHQELPVHAYLNVAENIFLGRQPRNKFGLIDFNEMNKQAKNWLNMIKADVDPKALLGSLPVAKQQLVSVAKALSLEAKIIFLDEPSAVLTIANFVKFKYFDEPFYPWDTYILKEGIIIFVITFASFAPSILAASRISLGIP